MKNETQVKDLSAQPACSACGIDARSINAERAEARSLRKAWVEIDDARQELEKEMTDAWTMLNMLSANIMDDGPTWPRVLEWLKRNDEYRPSLYTQNVHAQASADTQPTKTP